MHTLGNGAHLVGGELDHVVEHLHDDGTVVEAQGLAVDERLAGDIVPLAVAVDIAQLVILKEQTTDTETRAHPDVVHVVFDDGVDHVVQQTIPIGIDHWQTI